MEIKGDGPRILVVEDEPLTALALAETVAGLGADVVGPAWSLGKAAEILREQHIDGAVLDIKLQDRTVHDLAAQLRDRGISVVIVTAYSRGHLPRAFRDLPTVYKPFSLGELQAALTSTFGLHPWRRRKGVSFSHLG